MKKLKLSRFSFLIVCIVVLLSTGLFFISRQTSLLVDAPKPVKNVLVTIDKVIGLPFNLFDQAGTLLKAADENEQLREELEELKFSSQQLQQVKDENESLRASLGMKDSFADYQFLTGKVIVRTPVSWLNLLTVNLGDKDGVSQDMLASSDGGLIGKVTQVTRSSSTVSLLSDTVASDEIPVKITAGDNSVFGILTAYDQKTNRFEVTKLNSDSELKVGDSVETSGLDGKSVAGLSVGKVAAIKTSSDSLSRTIFVEPTADFSDIRLVTLVGD